MGTLPITTILEGLRSQRADLQDSLDPEGLRRQADELRLRSSDPAFWSTGDAKEVSSQLSRLESSLEHWDHLERMFSDLETMAELLEIDDDPELAAEFDAKSGEYSREVEHRQMDLLLSEAYDSRDAIVTIHAGSGGLDSQDWAEMLYRMYLRWCEENGYKTRLLDLQQDEEAGLKSVTFTVSGSCAYGYLKSETGVHRLVRISPFDTNKRRHTSFSGVVVSPQLPDDVEVAIRDEDLRIDTYRSSGAGGQHVNMTDSAVRITHLPTGIVVSCQNERSQHMNKATAMQVLRSKLYDLQVQNRRQELDDLAGEKKESSWGHQIRSYVLQPYTLVKDHRTGEETGNVAAVLDGDLDRFILAYLRWRK
ncbi:MULTISPECIES: peptide chain release factor 2 [Jonquetella]|uniref:Peptide chain release factor 2 n=1 Tax=Jonquetella anthropi DSM 22815 TaxID=885272 RepID=H0UL54_9BACT|nr:MULTISPECIES: peptide chain release factor 2 [Jonquetella]EHM13413.1 peptide chain release factor 2 [Jonquetella anthropi DSM 22815]